MSTTLICTNGHRTILYGGIGNICHACTIEANPIDESIEGLPNQVSYIELFMEANLMEEHSKLLQQRVDDATKTLWLLLNRKDMPSKAECDFVQPMIPVIQKFIDQLELYKHVAYQTMLKVVNNEHEDAYKIAKCCMRTAVMYNSVRSYNRHLSVFNMLYVDRNSLEHYSLAMFELGSYADLRSATFV